MMSTYQVIFQCCFQEIDVQVGKSGWRVTFACLFVFVKNIYLPYISLQRYTSNLNHLNDECWKLKHVISHCSVVKVLSYKEEMPTWMRVLWKGLPLKVRRKDEIGHWILYTEFPFDFCE